MLNIRLIKNMLPFNFLFRQELARSTDFLRLVCPVFSLSSAKAGQEASQDNFDNDNINQPGTKYGNDSLKLRETINHGKADSEDYQKPQCEDIEAAQESVKCRAVAAGGEKDRQGSIHLERLLA